MLKADRIACARIFDDIIKADRIVDAGEMKYWRHLCTEYELDRDIRIEAQNISFAEAASRICQSNDPSLWRAVLKDCRGMTVSDGFCAHSEALYMIALEAELNPDASTPGEIISIPRASFNVDIGTALYIESSASDSVNEIIRTRYRAIYRELQLAGVHFVYIPHIIDHYRNTDETLLHDILSFLAPQLSRSALDEVKDSLLRMSTADFTKDLLCNKCGISSLRATPPSLLLKIGHSFVGDVQYSNYLRLSVDTDLMSIVETFTDKVLSMERSDTFIVNTSEERGNQFHFHGFYKQLLELFLIRKNIRSSVVLDPWKEEIYFPGIDMKAPGLHRRERALYALLLCYGPEGINFDAPRKNSEFSAYLERLKRVQRSYSAIYELFGGEPDSAPDLTVPEIRRPIVSCLKRSLRSLKTLYNPEDYNVTKSREGSLCVHIERELVFVADLKTGILLPLEDSRIYARWKSLQ